MYGKTMYIKWHMQTISGYGNLTRTLQDDRKKHEIKWKHVDIYVVMQKKMFSSPFDVASSKYLNFNTNI